MNPLRFSKIHVCGNDFVLLDTREVEVPLPTLPALARAICHRRTGVGGDELVYLSPLGERHLRLWIFNPDGSEAPLCGNAVLGSVGLFAETLGFTGSCRVETAAGTREVCVLNEFRVRMDMGVARIDPGGVSGYVIDDGTRKLPATFLNTGTAHVVVPVEALDSYPVERVGRDVETDVRFGPSTNVMFVERRESGLLRMRSWERGGTGETLACGTGSCASAYTASLLDGLLRGRYEVRCPGGTLTVDVEPGGRLFLTGHGHRVFTGTWEIGSDDDHTVQGSRDLPERHR